MCYKLPIILGITCLIRTVVANGITITHSPDSLVTRGSAQSISWSVPENVTLQMVTLDLYRNGGSVANLGHSTSNTRSFLWKVSRTAPFGSDYYVKVVATSETGRVAWANTPGFRIGSTPLKTDPGEIIAIIVCILLVTCCAFGYHRRSNRKTDSYWQMGEALPVTNPTQPMAGTVPVCYPPPPIYTGGTRSGYSGSSMAAGVVAGAIGGAMLDNTLHHGNGSSFGGGGSFGGGIFGGDGAGDSGGGF